MRCPSVMISFLAGLLAASFGAAEDKPLSPAKAAEAWKLPTGFKATLFAGEPDIVQPMAFTFDDRGRVWVVECLSYPTWKEDGTGNDRVTILEDTNGDGRSDKRTVFYDKGGNLSGIEVGFGGVWLTAVPNLIFIPDKDGNDKPDGPPTVLLDGWSLEAKHNVVGNLAWGPDGWLYGCNGILSNSKLGKPGTPDNQRTQMNCGVWRYHPTRHQFEAYAHGTTNPWGLDWDERGQMFITNCVIKHIFHVMPGAHFERMFGQDISPHSYRLIESCADHQHWAGGHWTTSRGGEGAHGDAGGGHAHSGCMVYLGDNWPDEYRGNAFMCNIHGQRLNRDRLEPKGSTYVASHEADFGFSEDPWFRGVAVKYGSDGGVYVSDWSDTGECHDQTEQDCDKTGGRIFKIVYESAAGKAVPGVPSMDLAKLRDLELIKLLSHKNEWQARHARRILQERASQGKLDYVVGETLKKLLFPLPGGEEIPAAHRLRALLTLHACGRLTEGTVLQALKDPQPEIRAWAATLAVEARAPSQALQLELVRMSPVDDPFVRAHLAALIPRMPPTVQWGMVQLLLSQPPEKTDEYLTLMTWYAAEPLVATDPRKAIELLPIVKVPLVRQFLTRRIVAVHEGDGEPKASNAWILDELFRTLAETSDDVRMDIFRGVQDAYAGRRSVAPPTRWPEYRALLETATSEQVVSLTAEMAVLFGDREQIARLEDIVMRRTRATAEPRRRALQLLATKADPEFGSSLLALVRDEDLRADAIRALAAYDLPEIAPRLLRLYPELSAAERQDVIQTLCARPTFALALLDAIEKGEVPRTEVSALTIRQLQTLEHSGVSQRLADVWGTIRPASADKKQRIDELKSRLTPRELKLSDLSRGRLLFEKNCGACHRLFDTGSKLGPELTGSQRANLDYVLDNVLDPSAIVPREYKVQVLRLTSGRVVQGVVIEETPLTLAVQTANETVRVPVSEIEARKESSLSMMPEGLFDRLAPDEIRDLVAYLASPTQLPLPAQDR